MRNPHDRRRMTHIDPSDPRIKSSSQGPLLVPGAGKVRTALSNFRVLDYLATSSLVEVKPHTGRTHQIRVHCAAIGHPLIGDHLYGKKSLHINRQALHALSLAFTFGQKNYNFSSEPPQDFKDLLTAAKSFIQ